VVALTVLRRVQPDLDGPSWSSPACSPSSAGHEPRRSGRSARCRRRPD